MTGTAAAQALTIIATPILSRLYGPEAFGVFALYTSIVSVLSVITTWKYELAIVLPKKDEDAVHLLTLSSLIVLVMTVLTSLVILLFKNRIEIMLGTPELSFVLMWVPISICAFGFYQSLNYWSTRKKGYKRLSISQIIRSLSVVISQLTGGVLKFGSAGLVFSQAFGHIVATIVLGKQIWNNDKGILKRACKSINIKKIRSLARDYSDFPKYSAPQAFINSISQNAAPFLLSIYFSPAVVGFYAIGLKLLQLPVNLIGESVRQVYFQKAAELHNNGVSLRTSLIKTTVALFGLACIPSTIIFLFGSNIFSLILGDNWHEAGVYASWMVLWLFFVFITRPTIALFQVLRLQRVYFIIEILGLILKLSFLILTTYAFHNAAIVIAVYSLVNAGFYLFLFLYIYIKIKALNSSKIH